MKFQKSNTDNIDFLGSRILIIAAHPDDDILGCGGMLAKLQKKLILKLFLSPKVLPVDIFLVMTQIKLILKYKKEINTLI